jgi:hypothetical protein
VRYFIDTEFNEDGHTIALISIGIVAEDGRELYAVNNEVRREDCNQWVQDHVWPHLYRWTNHDGPLTVAGGRSLIRREIEAFIDDDPNPEFWGYFSDYDWVVFCWLWGAMIDLPASWPKFCLDLKQEAVRLGVKPKDLVAQEGATHNALDDARWNAKLFAALIALTTP